MNEIKKRWQDHVVLCLALLKKAQQAGRYNAQEEQRGTE